MNATRAGVGYPRGKLQEWMSHVCSKQPSRNIIIIAIAIVALMGFLISIGEQRSRFIFWQEP